MKEEEIWAGYWYTVKADGINGNKERYYFRARNNRSAQTRDFFQRNGVFVNSAGGNLGSGNDAFKDCEYTPLDEHQAGWAESVIRQKRFYEYEPPEKPKIENFLPLIF